MNKKPNKKKPTKKKIRKSKFSLLPPPLGFVDLSMRPPVDPSPIERVARTISKSYCDLMKPDLVIMSPSFYDSVRLEVERKELTRPLPNVLDSQRFCSFICGLRIIISADIESGTFKVAQSIAESHK